MSWLKIDDKLWSHPKVLEVGDRALGVWLRIATWSAQHETDGKVSAGALRLLCGQPRTEAVRALISAGLLDELPGESGAVQVHDFLEWNPSHEDLEAGRQAAKERMRRARAAERSRAVRANEPPNDPPNGGRTSSEPIENEPGKLAKHRDGSGLLSSSLEERGVSGGEFRRLELAASGCGPSVLRSHQLVEFERFWSLYPRKDDRPDAEAAFARLNPTPETVDRMTWDVKRRGGTRAWREPQFIPKAAKYIRNAPWTEPLEPEVPPIEEGSPEADILARLSRRRGTKGAA